MRRHPVIALASLALLAALAALAGAERAAGLPTSPRSAVVALGDSFASGEGGRWLGNSRTPFGDRDGTDRAAHACGPWGCRYDPARVYGASERSGCHRSDTAPVHSARLPVDAAVNLACSGARARDLWRGPSGGTTHRGQPPQADALAALARRVAVRMVLVTAGANDLGFGRLVLGCVLAWTFTPASDPRHCRHAAHARLAAAMPELRARLARTIAEVRAAMRSAGYARSDYRLVIAGYASPLPAGSAMRYAEGGWERLGAGCPVWDADATWARRVAVPWIADTLGWVAARAGAEWLDLRGALAGHELCHRGSAEVGGGERPRAASAEWVRALAPGQGSPREALHPNAYGQRALGRCIALLWKAAPGAWSCRRAGPRPVDAALAPAG